MTKNASLHCFDHIPRNKHIVYTNKFYFTSNRKASRIDGSTSKEIGSCTASVYLWDAWWMCIPVMLSTG